MAWRAERQRVGKIPHQLNVIGLYQCYFWIHSDYTKLILENIIKLKEIASSRSEFSPNVMEWNNRMPLSINRSQDIMAEYSQIFTKDVSRSIYYTMSHNAQIDPYTNEIIYKSADIPRSWISPLSRAGDHFNVSWWLVLCKSCPPTVAYHCFCIFLLRNDLQKMPHLGWSVRLSCLVQVLLHLTLLSVVRIG